MKRMKNASKLCGKMDLQRRCEVKENQSSLKRIRPGFWKQGLWDAVLVHHTTIELPHRYRQN
jgi:hypothetical protein